MSVKGRTGDAGMIPWMDRRRDRMTAHILEAGLFIQMMRGRSSAAGTLFARGISFETAFRVLVYPDERRKLGRKQLQG